jgi:hypothetical protein
MKYRNAECYNYDRFTIFYSLNDLVIGPVYRIKFSPTYEEIIVFIFIQIYVK